MISRIQLMENIAPRCRSPFAIVLTVLLILNASTSAQERSSNTTLTICNKTSHPVSTILIHRDPNNANQWILNGWYTANARSCRDVAGIPRGYFYAYADQHDTGRVWSGEARHICVDTRAVERVLFKGESCLVGEKNVGFFENYSTDERFGLNFQEWSN